MTNRKTTLRILQATVSAAAFAVGSSAYAQTVYTLDQSTLGATSIDSINALIAAAVEGASATGIDQTGLASANSISADIAVAALDVQAIDQGLDPAAIVLNAENLGIASTVFDAASAGGTQTAFSSLNTVSAATATEIASIDLTQFTGAGVDLTSQNAMVAGVAGLGSAAIGGAGGAIASEQLAVVSLNTASFAAIGTAPDLLVNDLLVNLAVPQSTTGANLTTENFALAYAPAPLTGFGDPSIDGLDQAAAVTVNSLGFGRADVAGDPAVTTPDANGYTLNIQPDVAVLDLLQDNGSPIVIPDSYDVTANGTPLAYTSGQTFIGTDADIDMSNAAVATTIGDVADFDFYSGVSVGLDSLAEFSDLFAAAPPAEGIGPVVLSNGQQVSQLNVNGVSSISDGGLTISSTPIPLVEVLDPINFPTVFTTVKDGLGNPIVLTGTFQQSITDLDLDNPGFDNLLVAATLEGDASVSDYLQVASVTGNSISSSAGLDLSTPVVQTADGSNSFQLLNGAGAYTENGAASISDLTQSYTLSLNSVSAGDALTGASLTQEFGSTTVNIGNAAFAGSTPVLAGYGMDSGAASVTDLAQIAQVNINSVSADSLGGLSLTQTFAGTLDISNFASALVDTGTYPITGANTASVSGAVQAAIGRVNSITN